MRSSVLRSDKAIAVNIAIVRIFVKLRSILATNKNLARRVAALERSAKAHDERLNVVFEAIEQLLAPEPSSRSAIGFKAPEE